MTKQKLNHTTHKGKIPKHLIATNNITLNTQQDYKNKQRTESTPVIETLFIDALVYTFILVIVGVFYLGVLAKSGEVDIDSFKRLQETEQETKQQIKTDPNNPNNEYYLLIEK